MASIRLPGLLPALLLVASALSADLRGSSQVFAEEVVLLPVEHFDRGVSLGIEARKVSKDRALGPIDACSGAQLGVQTLR